MEKHILKVFTSESGGGNPLATFILDEELTQKEMQALAKGIGFSETSFILSKEKKDGAYDVRIFSPDSELPFAGHPTLGTAAVIRKCILDEDEISLNLKSGRVNVKVDRDIYTLEKKQGDILMDIPKSVMARILSLSEEDISDEKISIVSTGLESVICFLRDEEALAKVKIDSDSYSTFLKEYCNCCLYLLVKKEEDFLARCFVEDEGYFEDPATGSAATNLATYLLKKGERNLSFKIEQGIYMGIPCAIYVKTLGDNIYIGGKVRW